MDGLTAEVQNLVKDAAVKLAQCSHAATPHLDTIMTALIAGMNYAMILRKSLAFSKKREWV